MKTIQEIKDQVLQRNMGFIHETDLPEIIAANRFEPLLVRCGRGRFVAPAQDVKHFIQCVEKGGDYVRDVSFQAQEVHFPL